MTNELIFCLSPSLLLRGFIHLLCCHSLSAIHLLSTLSSSFSPHSPLRFYNPSVALCCGVQAWLTEIHEYAQQDVVIMLLGNKVRLCNSTNPGRWMHRWTHSGRDVEGGLLGARVYGRMDGCARKQGESNSPL